jgi:hypothetical protein
MAFCQTYPFLKADFKLMKIDIYTYKTRSNVKPSITFGLMTKKQTTAKSKKYL